MKLEGLGNVGMDLGGFGGKDRILSRYSYFYSQRPNYKNVIKRIICGDLNMQYEILLRFERAELLVYWDKWRMEWLYSVFYKILPGEDKVSVWLTPKALAT